MRHTAETKDHGLMKQSLVRSMKFCLCMLNQKYFILLLVHMGWNSLLPVFPQFPWAYQSSASEWWINKVETKANSTVQVQDIHWSTTTYEVGSLASLRPQVRIRTKLLQGSSNPLYSLVSHALHQQQLAGWLWRSPWIPSGGLDLWLYCQSLWRSSSL